MATGNWLMSAIIKHQHERQISSMLIKNYPSLEGKRNEGTVHALNKRQSRKNNTKTKAEWNS